MLPVHVFEVVKIVRSSFSFHRIDHCGVNVGVGVSVLVGVYVGVSGHPPQSLQQFPLSSPLSQDPLPHIGGFGVFVGGGHVPQSIEQVSQFSALLQKVSPHHGAGVSVGVGDGIGVSVGVGVSGHAPQSDGQLLQSSPDSQVFRPHV
jgi:hypothetical protein